MGKIEKAEIKQYIEDHIDDFNKELLSQAGNSRDKVDEILKIGNIDLVNNAHKLVGYIMDGKEAELRAFADQEGIAWATYSLTLSFKLQWVQAIRRTLWMFIERFGEIHSEEYDFFELEKQINNRVDDFLNAFFINYSTYKDTLLLEQRTLVENLSVPIIPISPTISILPLIGSIDYFRAKVMEEKVLMEVSKQQIQILILDLSGIADMNEEVIDQFTKLIHGSNLMGCKVTITGVRPNVARKMVDLGVTFDEDTKTLGTLQHALDLYLGNFIPDTSSFK